MKRKIFSEEINLKEGDEHESISNVREFLERMGYVGLPADAPADAPVEALAVFDGGLDVAVRKYQRFHGLEVTGVIDEETRQVMEMPRCGVSDLEEGQETHSPGVASFVASGGKWQSNQLTYKFINGTDDLPSDTERGIVRQAFDVWSEVTPLTFTEVTGSTDATILISWELGDHGDGASFDGAGHVLAHAFFPPPVNPHPGIAGDMHFDDAETWATTHGGGDIDLLSVAIHELGHALGLRHSNVSEAIMFPTYSGLKHTLAADDIEGIQSIYGSEEQELSWFQRLIQWILNLFGLG
jgi:hypothetical protein